jgi:hypothetical protein
VLIDKEDCASRSLLRQKEKDGDIDRSSESEGEDIEQVEFEGEDIEKVEGEDIEEVEGKGKQVAVPIKYSPRREVNIESTQVMFKEMTAHKIAVDKQNLKLEFFCDLVTQLLISLIVR